MPRVIEDHGKMVAVR